MQTTVIGGGYFLPPGHPSIQNIKGRYRIRNPEYGQALALREKGKWVEMPDEWVYACDELPPGHPWQGGLAIPRGIADATEGFHNLLGSTPLHDYRSYAEIKALQTTAGFEARSYQSRAVEQLKKHQSGIVVAPCGSGKTAIGVLAISRIPAKALVLVHTLDLARQWIDRCRQMLGIEATLVGQGKKDDSGRVVVATFQTLARWRWTERYDWAKQFGLVVADEVHHTPSRTFRAVMMTMPARYRLGLTATPDRPDGLTDLMWWHFGRRLLELSQKDMISAGLVMAPKIEWLHTGWEGVDGPSDWPAFINKMTKDAGRNQSIIERVHRAVEEGRQVLVLSDRVAHCESLAETFRAAGIPSAALVGRLSKTKRAQLLADAGARKLLVVTATTIADEGLDLPRLDTVMLTTPTKAMGRIQQRIGRVMRTADGKRTPLVIDLVDEPGSLRGLARKRFKLYSQMGCV